MREALAQIKKEFEEANQTHARELAEVREGSKKAKETYEREMNQAQSSLRQLQGQLKGVSH